MKTVIIDEHEVARLGVGGYLANSPFEIIANCSNLTEYAQFTAGGSPVELVLSEAIVGGMGPRKLIEEIKPLSGDAKLVFFSRFDHMIFVRQAQDSGADGFIAKGVTSLELLAKLEDLREHGSLWSSDEQRQTPVAIRHPSGGTCSAAASPTNSSIG